MDVRRLLIFRQVARSGSLAAAARELGWTQPAVSQHVQALEREARTALVLRTPRGVVPTPAGEALLAHADAIATRLRAAEEEVAALAGLQSGTVRFAAFPSASAALVPAALRALSEKYPGVSVELTEAEPPEALALVQAGEVDAAVVFSYEELPDPGGPLVTHRLGDDPVRAVLPAGHRLAGRDTVRLAELADERWITGCPRCRSHLLASCRAAGFEPDIRHSTDDYVVTQALVAQGLAVSLMPALALRTYRHPEVDVVAARGAGARHLALVQRVESTSTPAVRAVLDAVVRAASDEPDLLHSDVGEVGR